MILSRTMSFFVIEDLCHERGLIEELLFTNERLLRKIPFISKVSQISFLPIHWVTHTVQKPQTSVLFLASNGITIKVPKMFDGSTSWFKYERAHR